LPNASPHLTSSTELGVCSPLVGTQRVDGKDKMWYVQLGLEHVLLRGPILRKVLCRR
jgi:predicted nuclease of restriction endonuclease-like (RecB) superfamily